MVKWLAQKFLQGAKEEIRKEPIELLNTEKLLEWMEIAIPAGILIFLGLRGFRKPPQPLTVVINNYIPKGIK